MLPPPLTILLTSNPVLLANYPTPTFKQLSPQPLFTMSHHEIGDSPTTATDNAIVFAPPDWKQKPLRKKIPRTYYYEKQKGKALSDLRAIIEEKDWHRVDSSLNSSGPKTIENTFQWVKYAWENGLNENNVFKEGEKQLGDKEKPTNAVKDAVIQVLSKCLPKENDGDSIGTTSETDTKRKIGSRAQQTIYVPSLPPPSSPPLSPEATPHGGQVKKRKISPERYFDITTQSSQDDEELRRKDMQDSVATRADEIYSQLKGHRRLNDDTLYIVSKAFELDLPPSNPPARILHPLWFKIDCKEIPLGLRDIPEPGERIYAPLHHESSGHWTLCVIGFELDSESNADSNSESKSIRLDFYDSLKNGGRANGVKTFFTRWIEKRYPKYAATFHEPKSAQQKDGTSCGIFVLETMRRLIVSEDVTRTIKPMDVRENLLNTISSLETYPPSDSELAQVLKAIKVLHGRCNTSPNMAQPSFPTLEPKGMVSPRQMIDYFMQVIVSGGISVEELISRTQKEYQQITEELGRLEHELRDAQKKLDTAKTRASAFEEAFNEMSESTRSDETVDPPSIGSKTQTAEDEPMTDQKLDPCAKKPRSLVDLSAQFCSLTSAFLQKQRDDDEKKREETRMETRRMRSEEIEMAERKVKKLSKQVADLDTSQATTDAFITLCLRSSNLQQKGGGDVDVL
ncbi:uncharacterized protein FTOL_13205 [Fusarium torulosum]|uniref:Ubiquitin-like protease family profile domain-containing protein n=1 Tax=Fusarium torulosum TaxID=33205 RepID=A0AAE8MND2_9HYPO|nr:uncharacterized protein FTOL_13205 [Fusarium torulosum]